MRERSLERALGDSVRPLIREELAEYRGVRGGGASEEGEGTIKRFLLMVDLRVARPVVGFELGVDSEEERMDGRVLMVARDLEVEAVGRTAVVLDVVANRRRFMADRNILLAVESCRLR